MQWFLRIDLNARFDMNFVRLDVNCETITVAKFGYILFF